MHFAVDPGSTHMNKKEYVEEIVKRSLDAGASSIKFQLFPDLPEFTSTGNIALSKDNFEHALKVGQGKVTASVFDSDSLQYLISLQPPYLKFAFSKRNWTTAMVECLNAQIPIVVTATIWDNIGPGITKLTTAYQGEETLYPNPYMMDFSGLFPEYFQGYSDHSIGWHNAFTAKLAGCGWLEKHMMLEKSDILCPDAKFASTDWSKLKHFV